MDCDAPVDPAELEDSFLKYEGIVPEAAGKRFLPCKGHQGARRFCSSHCGASVEVVSSLAKEKGVTVTQYLVAVLIMAIDTMQCREVRLQMRRKPVKVSP